jgi:hypothetical protein
MLTHVNNLAISRSWPTPGKRHRRLCGSWIAIPFGAAWQHNSGNLRVAFKLVLYDQQPLAKWIAGKTGHVENSIAVAGKLLRPRSNYPCERHSEHDHAL